MAIRGRTAVLAAVLGLVTACSGRDPEPATLTAGPPPSLSATITAVPGEAPTTAPTTAPAPAGPPALLPAAMVHTPDGAAAFVQHWFDTLEYSWAVMDSEPLRGLGECLTCNAFADTINSVNANGYHLEGGKPNIENVQSNAVDESSGASSVVVLFSAPEQRELDLAGKTVTVLDMGVSHLSYFFDLNWLNGLWSVASIRTVE